MSLGFGHDSGTTTTAAIGWANMTPLQRAAHSLKYGTAYQNNVDPGMLEMAARYLEQDSRPALSNSGDSLATLYAMENTKAQQQEQAAANNYGFSNAQQSAYDSLTSNGLVDADGNLVTDGLSKQELYDLWSSGFGLGETEAHTSLRDQAHAAFAAISSPGGTIELPGSGGGLTFGGGSVVTDDRQGAPKPEAQCGPGQIQVRGVCVDWDGPSGAGDNGGGQANPNRRGPSTTGTGYLGAGAGPANTGIGQAGQNQATPWADAYFRAKERASAQGPVSRLFANELEGR